MAVPSPDTIESGDTGGIAETFTISAVSLPRNSVMLLNLGSFSIITGEELPASVTYGGVPLTPLPGAELHNPTNMFLSRWYWARNQKKALLGDLVFTFPSGAQVIAGAVAFIFSNSGAWYDTGRANTTIIDNTDGTFPITPKRNQDGLMLCGGCHVQATNGVAAGGTSHKSDVILGTVAYSAMSLPQSGGAVPQTVGFTSASSGADWNMAAIEVAERIGRRPHVPRPVIVDPFGDSLRDPFAQVLQPAE